MTNLQTIRQACIKANPSILDLVFGCKVRLKDGSCETITKWAQHDRFPVFLVLGNGIEYIESEIEEILGRSIRLTDVLLAIKAYKIKLDFDTRSQPFLFITDWKEKTVIWNLLKDNLEDQSEETLEFISNLLKS